MNPLLQDFLEQSLQRNIANFDSEKLCEHASYRAYFRIRIEGESYILMQMPAGLSSASEEITNYEGNKKELPFVNIQRHLNSLKLPVPQFIAWDEEKKLMLLEDVGDEHLELLLKDVTEEERIRQYQKAITLLLELQKKTSENPQKDCIAFHRSFDENLLNWEFDHFLEYGIEDRFQIKIPEADKKIFTEITRQISKEIAASPYVFVHRDFQSRNLMRHENKLFILDFQDALMGPSTYDLVSLTRDSYIELSPHAVETLINFYLEKRDSIGLKGLDAKAFKRLFYQNTLQRKLKDTGRFQFIKTVKGNPSFLVSVPSSLRYIRQAFDQLPEYESLRKWIAKYVIELH